MSVSNIGKLEKVKIFAYNNIDYADNHQVGEVYTALINPETYALDYKVEFNQQQGNGTTAASATFNVKLPDEIQFDFLFDCTGVIAPTTSNDITDDLDQFKALLLDYDSDSHEPKHFKLVWGKLIFKGRCKSVSIQYKLFNPDGTPIRAICKVGFVGSIEDTLRVAIESPRSPDLTHLRTVKEGDTLQALCYEIYGDVKPYIQIAKVNQLINFRKLIPGQVLKFPPIAK